MVMELYLYADVLFLVNFTMDFLSLYIAASLTRRRVKALRLTLASAIGALYGVASCFMGGTLLFRIAINIAVAFVMCIVAFNGRILPAVAVFYTCGCMLGGIMTALFSFADGTSLTTSMLDRGNSNTFGDIPLGWAAVVAIVAALAAIAGGRIIKKRGSAFDVTVTVVSDTGCYVFDGICDSGNLLTDPIGGQAVIILEKEAFLSTLKASDRAFFEGFERFPEGFPLRIIPSDTVNGHGLLYGYLPRRVSVNGSEKNAVVAMGDGTFDGRKALVPSTLCER
jgi:sigma-E processing peptidase SpoIIGA